jgi:hypothetical protein
MIDFHSPCCGALINSLRTNFQLLLRKFFNAFTAPQRHPANLQPPRRAVKEAADANASLFSQKLGD